MLPLKDDDRPVDSWKGWLPVKPINSWTGDSPTRVGYEAANGAAMNIATVKTNNVSIRDVRRYDESIFRMMRVEGTWSSQGLFVIVAHNLSYGDCWEASRLPHPMSTLCGSYVVYWSVTRSVELVGLTSNTLFKSPSPSPQTIKT